MVTTQIITPMAAQAIVTCTEPRAASAKASATLVNVIRTVLSGVSQLATIMVKIPRKPA